MVFDALPKKRTALNVNFECNIGLVNASTKQYVPLRADGEMFYYHLSAKKALVSLELKNTGMLCVHFWRGN